MCLRFEVDPPQELGEILGNTRRVVGIKRGSFEGPRLRGEVLPTGADWQYTRPDGVVVLEARYILKTDEGDIISVLNRGFRHGSPQLAAMLASGHQVPPSQYYFMTTPLFETASPDLQWLMRTIFVGQGQRERDSLTINVWQVGDDITT
jgi:hypothetical protein